MKKFFLFFILGLFLTGGVYSSRLMAADTAQTETEDSKAAAPSPSVSPKPAQAAPNAQAPSSENADEKSDEDLNKAEEELQQPQQPKHPNVITEVEIRGNQIVSTNTVLGKIRSQKGAPLVQETINEDVKRLYASGFFQDIKMEVEDTADGYRLIVNVLEKPIVREIVIDGNIAFKEDKIRKQIKLVEGQILDRKLVKQGVEAIRKLYSDKGYGFVDIESDVKLNAATKEATVLIHISEGGKFKIKTVEFSGNKAYKVKKLIKLMRTRKKSFPLRSGVFKEEYFKKDLDNVRGFYQQEGYLDVKIDPAFDYDKDKRWIYIKIAVDEGQHYVAGDIKITGNELFPESEIWQELAMLPGTSYSQYYLSKDIENIVQYYHKLGYMDARVVPDVRLNRENGKVDITYQITEGDLFFVDKVVVRGNTKTKDVVIRREIRLRPGEKFDGDKINKSKQRLQDLDYFEDVTYDTEPASAPNRKDLVFRVKEKRTGELSFGGGVSSVDRFVGFAEISQKNFDLFNWPRFTGAGQTLALRARVGSITKHYELSFIEPYLFGKPISSETSLYNTRRDNENTDFAESRLGAGDTLSKRITDRLSLGTGYTLERVKLFDISDDAPTTVTKFSGSNWLSRWKTLIASYDTRDSSVNPAKGMLLTFNGELVGGFLGGDQSYYILQSSATKYWTFWKKNQIELKFRLGTSQDFGKSDEVPVFDRFYAGGLGTVRGYGYRRVGPKESGDAIGGQSLAIANFEYTFPVPRLDAFKGAFFLDAGNVDPDSYRIGFSDFAVSVGPGIKVKTPIGPIALYYGLPIMNRDDKNRNGRFEFSLSRAF